jgi:hypothetical protein
MKTLRRTLGIIGILNFIALFPLAYVCLQEPSCRTLLYLLLDLVSLVTCYLLYLIAYAFRHHNFLIFKAQL